jgi:hypothetical protein
MLQFLTMIAVFVVAGFLWLKIVYRPGRTLEHWEGDRTEPAPNRSRHSEPPVGR